MNVGLPGIDEPQTMKKVISLVQEVINLPLQIDSSSKEAIEIACRYYNGKPLINSVNGKDQVLDDILPIVKKYGGVVIGLTLEDDIPDQAQDRYQIACKILQKAQSYGIEKENVIIGKLLPAGTGLRGPLKSPETIARELEEARKEKELEEAEHLQAETLSESLLSSTEIDEEFSTTE